MAKPAEEARSGSTDKGSETKVYFGTPRRPPCGCGGDLKKIWLGGLCLVAALASFQGKVLLGWLVPTWDARYIPLWMMADIGLMVFSIAWILKAAGALAKRRVSEPLADEDRMTLLP